MAACAGRRDPHPHLGSTPWALRCGRELASHILEGKAGDDLGRLVGDTARDRNRKVRHRTTEGIVWWWWDGAICLFCQPWPLVRLSRRPHVCDRALSSEYGR